MNHIGNYLFKLVLLNIKESKKNISNARGANFNKFNICAPKLNPTPSEFNFLQMYCNSKSCMTLFANELNRRLNKSHSFAICKSVHPGNM